MLIVLNCISIPKTKTAGLLSPPTGMECCIHTPSGFLRGDQLCLGLYRQDKTSVFLIFSNWPPITPLNAVEPTSR